MGRHAFRVQDQNPQRPGIDNGGDRRHRPHGPSEWYNAEDRGEHEEYDSDNPREVRHLKKKISAPREGIARYERAWDSIYRCRAGGEQGIESGTDRELYKMTFEPAGTKSSGEFGRAVFSECTSSECTSTGTKVSMTTSDINIGLEWAKLSEAAFEHSWHSWRKPRPSGIYEPISDACVVSPRTPMAQLGIDSIKIVAKLFSQTCSLAHLPKRGMQHKVR
ncbi:hypothetical protein BJ878DRAFT_548965 [Calycina marina]|uniref:Uncharacterized protein n=1 Tax=Calycina marina TaxID=1763456 RepID=A0A9P8CJ20_9HELO|nr:hypothetical protein BJ878DRAFT_548965 [Calycina marina]